MKIYPGPGLVADKSGAMVLPVRIDGAQYTPFSRLRGRIRLRWFPPITLTILPPRRLEIPSEVRGRERRRVAGKLLGRPHDGDDVRDVELPAHAVRRAARRAPRTRRPARHHRGRRARAADLQPADRSCVAARRAHRGRDAARQGRGRDVAERDRCRGHVVRLAVPRPGRRDAELHARRQEPRGRLPGRGNSPRLHLGAVRGRRQARAPRRQVARGDDRRISRGPARAHHAVAQGQSRHREPLRQPALRAHARQAGRSRHRAVHVGLRGHAERRGVVARQRAREPRAGRGAHRLQLAGRDPERAAVVPLVRSDGGHAAAAAVGHAHVLLPVAAALPHRSRDRLRRERDDHVRHEHVPRRLRALRAPVRFLQRALRVRRRREAQGRDAPHLDG